ncbi:MAG: hypothetical protein AB7I25_01035 [Vicinamibacterales bacterium]
MEVSSVRKQLQTRITESRRTAKVRREAMSQAQAAYDAFLVQIAVPVVKQLVSALKAEGFAWSVSTPSGMVRMTADAGREDFVEIDFDASGAEPKVVGRSSRGRGSRLMREEQALAEGALPSTITDQDVLDYLLSALTPWLER